MIFPHTQVSFALNFLAFKFPFFKFSNTHYSGFKISDFYISSTEISGIRKKHPHSKLKSNCDTVGIQQNPASHNPFGKFCLGIWIYFQFFSIFVATRRYLGEGIQKMKFQVSCQQGLKISTSNGKPKQFNPIQQVYYLTGAVQDSISEKTW